VNTDEQSVGQIFK